MYTFTEDLLDDILERVGELTTSTLRPQALKYLNRAQFDIINGGTSIVNDMHETWLWARSANPNIIILNTAEKAGTINVINGSSSATLTNAPSQDVTGWYVRISDDNIVYKISTHAGTNITLDQIYLGDTAANAEYSIFQLEYTIASDVLKIIAPLAIHTRDQHMSPAGIDLSMCLFPINQVSEGNPTSFVQLSDKAIRFNKYPENPTRVEYYYIQQPVDLIDTAGNQPVIPLAYRGVLSDVATYRMAEFMEDDNANTFRKLAVDGLLSMQLENEERLINMSYNFGRM